MVDPDPFTRAGASATRYGPGVTVVWRGDFPDPFLLQTQGRWFAYGTQTRDLDVQVMTSSDLLTWTHLGNALAGLPRWAAPGHTWSPAVLPRPDGYVLYYVTRLRAAGRQALSVAVADRPEGPYVDASDEPLVYQRSRGGSIDPDPFVDADGTPYLLWKSDDNALGGRTVLWVRQLRPDGLGFDGRPVKVLRQELAWQRPLVEAPSMVLHDGTYHLLYSAGRWESSGYGVGHATATRPTGPFTASSRHGPWLHGPDGPGGQSVARGGDGQLHMAYHAWLDGLVGYAAGGARALHVDRLDLTKAVPRLV